MRLSEEYAIAYAALVGILVLPAIIIWITSFSTCRTNRDPARRPFTIMKVAFPLYAVAYLFWTVSAILSIVTTEYYYGSYYYGDAHILEEAGIRIGDIGSLIGGFAQVALLLCIVDLGLSFLYLLSDKRTHHLIVLGVVAVFGLVLVVLEIAAVAKNEILITAEYRGTRRVGPDEVRTIQKLFSAYNILMWILSLVVAALCIYVFYLSRKGTELRRNADIYLAIGILNLLPWSYYLAYDIKFQLGSYYLYPPLYFNVLGPILGSWPSFIVLVLIFTIGCRNRLAFRSAHIPPKQQQQYYVPTPVMYYPAPPHMQPNYQPSPHMQQNYQSSPNGQQDYQTQPQAQQNYQAPHVQQVA